MIKLLPLQLDFWPAVSLLATKSSFLTYFTGIANHGWVWALELLSSLALQTRCRCVVGLCLRPDGVAALPPFAAYGVRSGMTCSAVTGAMMVLCHGHLLHHFPLLLPLLLWGWYILYPCHSGQTLAVGQVHPKVLPFENLLLKVGELGHGSVISGIIVIEQRVVLWLAASVFR